VKKQLNMVMNSELEYPSLAFLVSMPRSGSTLTQKILAANDEIVTCSEPWLMLFATQCFSKSGLNSNFGANIGREAIEEVVKLLPNGREDLIDSVRDSYGRIYSLLLREHPEKLFLDKTPRYYQIIPELTEVFPESRIVILLRHPLAVLCSNLTTWAKPVYGALSPFREDLLTAPNLLADAIESRSSQIYTVRYESLLTNSKMTLQSLCEWLGINYSDKMLMFGKYYDDQWKLGDQKQVYKSRSIQTDNVAKWKNELRNPRTWRLCREYADQLGSNLFQRLGYDWDEADQLLEETKPGLFQRNLAISFAEACSTNRLPSVSRFMLSKIKNRVANHG